MSMLLILCLPPRVNQVHLPHAILIFRLNTILCVRACVVCDIKEAPCGDMNEEKEEEKRGL